MMSNHITLRPKEPIRQNVCEMFDKYQ